jgi:RNA polymerase sigma factor (sigma-70 family)
MSRSRTDSQATHRAAPVEGALDVLSARRAEFVDFAAARMESRSAAEDLVQEALARAVERAGELRAGEAVLGWFYRLLRNAIVDHYRRRASAARALARLADEPSEAATTVRPPQTCRCVSRLAASLKPEYSRALERIEVDGAPLADLAGELGITPDNAAARVSRARRALRKKVVVTCGTCAESGCTDCTCDH